MTRPSPDSVKPRYHLPSDYEPNRSRGDAPLSGEYWSKRRLRLSNRYQYGVYRFARKLAEDIAARTVLDLGCGLATKLNRFFDERFHLIGVDTDGAVALCRRLHRRGNYVSLDLDDPTVSIERLPARPDLVICADVIEHVERPDVLLRLCRGMAERGAPIVLSTPCRHRLMGPVARRPSNPEHVREWSQEELRRYVEGHGLTVTDQRLMKPFQFGFDLMTASFLVNRLRRRLPITTSQVLTLRAHWARR